MIAGRHELNALGGNDVIDNLYLENFRRIERADIDIRDGITVLTGQNGTGKSTIIEGLLFCLYGKPKAGTPKESIPRSTRGENDLAYSSVDFTMDGLHYRCRRYITKKNSTIASLYSYTDDEYSKLLLQDDKRHLDKELGTQVATSATGVTAAVVQIIGLDYDGYKASLVATQKELDSLASLTKENKKKFFLDLLNYSKLDEAKKTASSETRDRKKIYEGLERQASDPKEIDKRIKETTGALADTRKRISKGVSFVNAEEERYRTITESFNALNVRHEKLSDIRNQHDEDVPQMAALEQRVADLRRSIADNESKSAGYIEGSNISERLNDAQMRLERARTYAKYQREYDRMNEQQSRRKKTLASRKAEVSRLEKTIADEPNLDEAQTALTDCEKRLAAVESERKRLESSKNKLAALIEAVDSGNTANCPTCGSDISGAEGRNHLDLEMGEICSDIDDADKQIDALQADVEVSRNKLNRTTKLLRTWNADMRALSNARSEVSMLENEIKANAAELSTRLSFFAEHSEDELSIGEMSRIEEEAQELLRQKANEDMMRTAFNALREDTSALAHIEKEYCEIKERIDKQEKELEAADSLENEWQAVNEEMKACDSTLRQYRERIEQLRRDEGMRESTIESLREQKAIATRQRDEMESILSEIEDWNAAKEVIEHMRLTLPARITPLLSEEASRLLDIATDGMYSMIEIDDDYEVTVYTESDIRPISLMSGGEQDIISLCIRIAIAEMILESAGNSGQTMVLDEIFGALDDSRKKSACDALANLRNTIPKIVCITHVDEIKDIADYTYVVERDENGNSMVREAVGSAPIEDAEG